MIYCIMLYDFIIVAEMTGTLFALMWEHDFS